MDVQISATEFKAKCLSLLDEVQASGATITVTKRGRPVATLGPCKVKPWKSSAGALADKGKIVGDIVNFHMHWEAAEPSEGARKRVARPARNRSKR